MTELLHEIVDAVKVHIVKDDTKEHHGPSKPKQPREVRTTYQTFTLSNSTGPAMLLGHAPNRIQAILQFVAAGPVDLADNRADAVKGDNSSASWASAAAGPIKIFTTGELWAASNQAGATTVSVIAEYEEK